jgi:hypothetical protein
MGADIVNESEVIDPLDALRVQVKEMKAALGTHHLEMQKNREYKEEMQRLLYDKRRKEQEALLNAKRLEAAKAAAEADAHRRLKAQRKKEAQFRENVSNMFNFGGDSSSDEDTNGNGHFALGNMFEFDSSGSESDDDSFDLSMDLMHENEVQLGEKSDAHKKLEAEFEAHKREAEAKIRAKEAEMLAKIAELEAKLSGGKKKPQTAPKTELGFGDLHAEEGDEVTEDDAMKETKAASKTGILSFDSVKETKAPSEKGILSFDAAKETKAPSQKETLSFDAVEAPDVKSSSMLDLDAMLDESSDSSDLDLDSD